MIVGICKIISQYLFNALFRGCEAGVVIVVNSHSSGFGMRSSLTRGVDSLCLITGDCSVNAKNMKKWYNVADVKLKLEDYSLRCVSEST